MNKKEKIEIIVDSPAWDGIKKVNVLMKNLSAEQVNEFYVDMEQAEREYYEEE